MEVLFKKDELPQGEEYNNVKMGVGHPKFHNVYSYSWNKRNNNGNWSWLYLEGRNT